MKVAYLIIAHNQPALLGRLVAALDCEWASFFLHVDLKSDIYPFRQAVATAANRVFLTGQDRIAVRWGGFSQVRATLNLLRQARAAGPFDRYCLLSGCDFPIQPLSAIQARLATATEFMRVDRRLGATDGNDHCQAVRRYYFLDWSLPRRLNLRLLSGKIPRGTQPPIPLYHGSQWWCLTEACVHYLLAFLERTPAYSAFHRYTLSPDEIFFHSIVKHSPFAAHLSHDFEQASSSSTAFADLNEHGCHYIDWNAPQKVLPKVLTMDDHPALNRSAALFARKFDEHHSAELIQTLVRKLGGELL